MSKDPSDARSSDWESAESDPKGFRPTVLRNAETAGREAEIVAARQFSLAAQMWLLMTLPRFPEPPNGRGVQRVTKTHAGFTVVQYYAGHKSLAGRRGQFA